MHAYSQSAQAWITQFYLQTTPCLPFLRKHSPDGALAPPQLRQQTSNCSLLLIYRPWKDERPSWPGSLTYSGWFTHVSGHPSATGRAQDKESSPAKDWRSTVVPTRQPFVGDYPGEPVPKETFTHPPSWSSSNLYQFLPSTTIHSILPVQTTCLAIFFHNLSPHLIMIIVVIIIVTRNWPTIMTVNKASVLDYHI